MIVLDGIEGVIDVRDVVHASKSIFDGYRIHNSASTASTSQQAIAVYPTPRRSTRRTG
jgi:hypothetical protein